ncbi:MAG: membrane dipeptidase [Chloroflexota bacterium]
MKRILKILAAAVIVIRLIGWQIERLINRIDRSKPLPTPSPEANAFHAKHFIADVHNDTLLFERNFLQRSTIGHIDLPRAQDAGVNLLVFAAATKIPLGFHESGTNDNLPDVLSIAYGSRFSPQTFMTSFQRAIHQSKRLHSLAGQSHGRMHVVRNQTDLERATHGESLGALLGFEGAQAVGDKVENVYRLFDAGYRVAGYSHFIDNRYAYSKHGASRAGLTPVGRELTQHCVELGMALDLAHLSAAGVEDVLNLTSDKPLLVSHTGLRSWVDNNRTIVDELAIEIAKRGGVIGIGFWDQVVKGNSAADVVDGIQYAIEVLGEDHVCFGSDFDGGILPSFDISELPVLTHIMLERGMSESTVSKITGENVLRLLKSVLPA